MCGADPWGQIQPVHHVGSPPRVRSRHASLPTGHVNHGITSACAEQTTPCLHCPPVIRDHLRVCGADILGRLPRPAVPGSPPRVRSRHPDSVIPPVNRGITSACAEQTAIWVDVSDALGDHLRVCGADADVRPPGRARIGITSACAEQTVVFYCVLSQLNGVEYLIYALRRVS